jgi:uncharacterized membrane protein (UPF0127 family)
MRVVHESEGEREVLATTVEEADSVVSQFLGLRFRASIPDDYALVFDFDGQRRGLTDMLFVRFPIDAVWLNGDEVVRVETLPAWTGLAYVTSDGFVELPAGTAADVEAGDRVAGEGGDAGGE